METATEIERQHQLNPREEIIALLRGQVACPLISTLGELGWLDAMAEDSFHYGSFPGPVDPSVFRSIMGYLVSLRLLEPVDEQMFRATKLGLKVFKRYGTFCILNSYEAYMRDLAEMLVPKKRSVRPQVNRARNVIGSGAIHGRKFFDPALKLLGKESFALIADIGCGDGEFLSHCIRVYPQASLLGVDVSEIAVDQTMRRIHGESDHDKFVGVVSDGADIDKWTGSIAPEKRSAPAVLISCWFLIHEISGGRPQVVIDFFSKLHSRCPKATVLIGEVVRLSQETLAINRAGSVLPELTLLHDLSRQGLLNWSQWQSIASQIPYVKTGEKHFDPVHTESGELVPSGFVWCLQPK